MDNQIPPEIRAFLENMLHAADDYNAGEEIPEGLLKELYAKLDDQISTYLLPKLSSENLTEYRRMKENNLPKEQLDIYLMRNIPDYKEIMKRAFRDFYDSYIEQAKEEREKNLNNFNN